MSAETKCNYALVVVPFSEDEPTGAHVSVAQIKDAIERFGLFTTKEEAEAKIVPEFYKVVQSFLNLSSVPSGQAKRLASEFECGVFVVERWASGASRPSPNVELRVRNWLKNNS